MHKRIITQAKYFLFYNIIVLFNTVVENCQLMIIRTKHQVSTFFAFYFSYFLHVINYYYKSVISEGRGVRGCTIMIDEILLDELTVCVTFIFEKFSRCFSKKRFKF